MTVNVLQDALDAFYERLKAAVVIEAQVLVLGQVAPIIETHIHTTLNTEFKEHMIQLLLESDFCKQEVERALGATGADVMGELASRVRNEIQNRGLNSDNINGFDSAVESVVDNMDLSTAVEKALERAIDLEGKIIDAMSNRRVRGEIEEVVDECDMHTQIENWLEHHAENNDAFTGIIDRRAKDIFDEQIDQKISDALAKVQVTLTLDGGA